MSSQKIAMMGLGGLAVTVASAADAATPSGNGESKPNFVVIIADDLGRDDLTLYGDGTVRTPNLESLAARAMRMDNAFLTASSSSPSRCSILTSLYPHKTGAQELHQPLPADRVTVAVPLREAGYYTASVGKWHQGPEVMNQFDLIVQAKQANPSAFGDDCIKALRERPSEKPFFIWAASTDPHRPYTQDTLRENPPGEVFVPPYYPDADHVREDLADYYNEITRFDRHVGMILAELECQGLSDNTFVVVMSDNGRPFPQAKTRCNLQGMATPMIVYYPPMTRPGSVSKALISSIDLMPTILELAGTRFPGEIDGRSFASILGKPSASFRKYAFAEHNFHDFTAYERAIYTTRHILIHNFLPELPGTPPADALNGKTYRYMREIYNSGALPISQSDIFTVPRNEYELFDYRSDRFCMENLCGKPSARGAAKKLSAELAEWRKATDDRFPGMENLPSDKYDRTTGAKIE